MPTPRTDPLPACSGDRPYLISGADDRTARVWDYQTKACVQTLEGHSHNVSACAFHPELPIIVTGSEDGTVRLWHSTTYRLENTLSYGLERLWSLGLTRGSNGCAGCSRNLGWWCTLCWCFWADEQASSPCCMSGVSACQHSRQCQKTCRLMLTAMIAQCVPCYSHNIVHFRL